MIRTLDNPLYYLDNFHRVMEWIDRHYRGLMNAEESRFVQGFRLLPQASQSLLVRMIMRKGDLFRLTKLHYEEIGCIRSAVLPLVEQGWVDAAPPLSIESLFAILTKPELSGVFKELRASARKADQLAALREQYAGERIFPEWCPELDECVYRLLIGEMCDRFRLMFFGNLRQDWTEFVLADLGIFKYEQVPLSSASLAFRTRDDVDHYLHLHRCRTRFHEGEAVADVMQAIPSLPYENIWLEGRRAKLLFQMGQQCEKSGMLEEALAIYARSTYAGARLRAIRVMERCEQFEAAHALAVEAAAHPEDDAEHQQLTRILPRLQRKLGIIEKITRAKAGPVPNIDLILPQPNPDIHVEHAVRMHLSSESAPAYYVENTLINSLFGLLCWQAIFHPVPGAFFHPFHSGPADLMAPDFHRRREAEFEQCLTQLDTEEYRQTIRNNLDAKAYIQSPFVAWGFITPDLVEQALDCIPPAHLKKWFRRILADIRSNRNGFPDLIQFWPQDKRYRMIEVKGPGDRLQDNQVRWLEFCAQHDMPVTVCYVQWRNEEATC
ncbi:VRR-NUC domain-containing protein [Noviherbaspirillum aerium]|uniref:VRR-NUC domain-containing protein n=1 Tax=Noviherbaspirillum aerium TaxID=2588497 RepID=UPI00124C4F92|nr:VRR-NUC domain-containing protein [Noviherbaspirillum aerium]